MRDYKPNYIPLTDFARMVRLSPTRVRELVLDGTIKGVRLGRYYYVHEREARSARFLRRAGRWRRNDPGMRIPDGAVQAEDTTPAVPEGENDGNHS